MFEKAYYPQVTGVFVACRWYYEVMKFDHLPQFIITNTSSEEYGEWVDKTAKLLGRPYAQLHTLFTKEKWNVDDIRTAYQNATKHCGRVTPQIAWWANRKRRNSI